MLLAVVSVVATVGVAQAADLWPFDSESPPRSAARRSVGKFFSTYLGEDGRVVRRDQGGDTVSEGQAYAMLLAAATNDGERFDSVWSWTRDHLQRSDGLLAWRWAGGKVVDRQSASDADSDAARALLLASDKFDEPDYRAEGLRIARAIMRNERVDVTGRPLVVAGPWGRPAPHVFNPSYFSPRAYELLEDETGATQWRTARQLGYELIAQMRAESGPLPPDWAKVTPQGDAYPVPVPGGDGEPLFSYDAARVPLRLAEACEGPGRALAAGLWPFFEERREWLAPAYSLDGRPMAGGRHPATHVGAAAAAWAAGAERSAGALLDRAEKLQRKHPTYYGAALVALGRVTLETKLLGSCPASEEVDRIP